MNVGIAVLDFSPMFLASPCSLYHTYVELFDQDDARDTSVISDEKKLIKFLPPSYFEEGDAWRKGLEALKNLCVGGKGFDTVFWHSLSKIFREGREIKEGANGVQMVNNVKGGVMSVSVSNRINIFVNNHYPEAQAFVTYLATNPLGGISDTLQKLFNRVYVLGAEFKVPVAEPEPAE